MTIPELKERLRNGAYAFPGGYPCYFIAADGEPLSFDAVRSNWREVVWSMLNPGCDVFWEIVECAINWEDESLYCSHTGKRIESAYGELEDD